MLNRVSSLLIGKNISRDPQVVATAQLDEIMKSTGLADGELVVLDKQMKVLTAGDTIDDSDTIYIVQSTGDTFDYTNKAGTAITGNRRIIMSGAIVGLNVKSYNGESYTAKAEQTSAIDFTGYTPVAGTEYLVRIVYKDVPEHPGQFTQTYRVIATTATTTASLLVDLFVAKINKHSGRRVNAVNSTGDVLTLTGRPIPACTSTVSDIDKFSMVEFTPVFNYVDSDGNWQTISSTSTAVTTTSAVKGIGTWEQVRDMEKELLGHRGITNLTQFPVIKPDANAVKSATYDIITIEHDSPYQSPDNQYVKTAPQTTVIAVYAGAAQTTSLLAQLNPWFASCPGAFSTVSV